LAPAFTLTDRARRIKDGSVAYCQVVVEGSKVAHEVREGKKQHWAGFSNVVQNLAYIACVFLSKKNGGGKMFLWSKASRVKMRQHI